MQYHKFILSFLSLVIVSRCLPNKRPAVISQNIWFPFASLSFFLSVISWRNLPLFRQRRLPCFPEKNSSGVVGSGVSNTCCTRRHGMRKTAPRRFLLSFVISYFPKRCCIRFKTRLMLFFRQHSFSFRSRGLDKAVLLEDWRKCLLLSWFRCFVEMFALNCRILRLLFSSKSQIF